MKTELTRAELLEQQKHLEFQLSQVNQQLEVSLSEVDRIVENNRIHNLNFTSQFIKRFPVEQCIHLKDDCYESETEYLCLIIDQRFNNEASLRIMRPYFWDGNLCKDTDMKGLFGLGWIDDNGNPISNFENPVSELDEYVMGFIKL